MVTAYELRLIIIFQLYTILACPIPEKATRGATGTKSGDFDEKEECSRRDLNHGPLITWKANALTPLKRDHLSLVVQPISCCVRCIIWKHVILWRTNSPITLQAQNIACSVLRLQPLSCVRAIVVWCSGRSIKCRNFFWKFEWTWVLNCESILMKVKRSI